MVESLESRLVMTVNAPEVADLLALSGGGFKAMVADAGMFASVMKLREIDVETLVRDDLAISANSGSTWFTNLLGYSDSFVNSLNDYENIFSTDSVTDMTVGGTDGFFGVMGEAYRGYLNQHLDFGFQNVLDELKRDLSSIRSLSDLTQFIEQAPRNLGRLFIVGAYDSGSSLIQFLDSKLTGVPNYTNLRDNFLNLFSRYDFKSILGVASVALLDGIDWNTFMQRTAFAPDQVDRIMQGVNFFDGQGRTNALSTQSLIYEMAISSDEAVVAPESPIFGSNLSKVSVTNNEAKYGFLNSSVYNFIPATATSRGNPTDNPAPWLPNIPSGDLQVEYDSPGLFNSESRTFNDLNFSGLSPFLASSISSSAAALSGSYGILSDFNSVLGNVFNLLDLATVYYGDLRITNVILDFTKGLAPLVQTAQGQNGSWIAGDPVYQGFNYADPINSTSNLNAANAGYLRMADGGYFDNSSVTSGLSYLQANQNNWVANDGNKDFSITLFVFSGQGETVSDTLRNRGFDNIGNVTQRLFTGGTQQEFKVPLINYDLVDVSHPNSAVFDSTRATGVSSPIWSYAAPANTPVTGAGFEIKAYTMDVETVANNTMNIGAGFNGTVHLWNIISKTGPIPIDNFPITGSVSVPTFGQWSDYEVMYNQILDGMTSSVNGVVGAGLLAAQLGINSNPTDISISRNSIDEANAVGSVVAVFSSSDIDSNDSFSYSLVSGAGDTDNAAFQVVGGQLRANIEFDFETKSSYTIRVRSTDQGGATFDKQFTITVVNINENPLIPTTNHAARTGILSTVPLIDVHNGQTIGSVVPFSGFSGEIRTVAGDVNGDGILDTVVAAGPGGGPAILIMDAQTGAVEQTFFAFDPAFTGGSYITLSDVNQDGRLDIVAGAGSGGGPHVKVFDGSTGNVLKSFFAYDVNFSGGVSVASVDINQDGILDLVTGAGPGGGPHVKVFDGNNGNLISQWFAYPVDFTGGVYVAGGDLGNNGTIEVVTGAGYGGAPVVAVWNPFNANLLAQFLAYDSAFTGGVRVAVSDGNFDGILDLVTGAGPGGGPVVKGFSFPQLDLLFSFFSGDPSDRSGVFVS